MLYLTLKWLHIVAIISWMAGILYLYRLLIYLAERGSEPQIHALLSMMAHRLYRFITLPAMLVALVLGFGMIGLNPSLAPTGWFAIKFVCVLGLIVSTIYAGILTRRFGERRGPLPSGKQLRILNELPTLLMIVIVAMVIFKPF